MSANESTTQEAFDTFGCKLEQMRSGVRVFRHAFESRNIAHNDAMSFLFALEDAAESLEDRFIALQNMNPPPEPQPAV